MESTAYFCKIYGNIPWNQRHISIEFMALFHGIHSTSMESTAKTMAFHELPQFFVVGLFAINCNGNLKNAVRILHRF